jgi:hypothetical protein
MLVLDVNLNDSNRFMALNEESLKKAAMSYENNHGTPSPNFTALLRDGKKFRTARLTPYYVLDKSNGRMMCLVEEYSYCAGNA